MPLALHVLSPNGQHQCAGEYQAVAGQEANGQPVFKQAGGDLWLYCGSKGMWIIGGTEARDKDFQCSHGNIFCRTVQPGATPDKITGSWSRLDKESFVEDEDITVLTSFSVPSALRLTSPANNRRCAGDYHLLPQEWVNGMPVWQLTGGKAWLYCGDAGRWIVGGADAKEKGFKCSRGVIYSARKHGGQPPHRCPGGWMALNGEAFVEDPSVVIAVKPSPIYLSSPHGQQRVAGEFVPMENKVVNGQPIWEHNAGKCWLYSGPNGMWIVGGSDAKAKNFACTRGVIFCQVPHNGQMPDRLVGSWCRLEGDAFREDAAIGVSTKAAMLYVVSPHGQQKCAGEYRLLGGEQHNGQAVWKQRKGNYRICSTIQGCWQIMGSSAGHPDGEVAVDTAVPHLGGMPDKVRRNWRRVEGEERVSDPGITVTTALGKPAKLHVRSPNGQQRVAGEYVLVAGTTANGQPLWRQMGGKYWLYSGTNGMWIFGSSVAREKHFDCSRGVIYSNTPHGGVMPDKLRSLWLRLDGDAFHEDAAIAVEGDHAATSRKRSAAVLEN